MAELVRKYPKRFPGFIASLPMNDPDGLLKEATPRGRGAGCSGRTGVHQRKRAPAHRFGNDAAFRSHGEDGPAYLDAPCARRRCSGLQGRKEKPLRDLVDFWLPYETSVAMAHIVFAGLFDKHPDLKIITHHLAE